MDGDSIVKIKIKIKNRIRSNCGSYSSDYIIPGADVRPLGGRLGLFVRLRIRES